MNIQRSLPYGQKIDWSFLSQLLVFMILPPIIGLPLTMSRIWAHRQTYNINKYVVFMVCVAAYMATINATKQPSGDQVQYFIAYKNVPTLGFWGSLTYIYGFDIDKNLTNISGEFMNGVYNYVGYHLTLGYYPLFVFLYTLVEYMLMFVGFYRFCRTLKEPHKPFVCGVLILSFFYLFFQYTLQIQKQFMAQAIMMIVLGAYAETGRMTRWLWFTVVCAVFTHASTWLFVPFLLYKPLRGRLNRMSLLVMTIAFTYGIFFAPRMAASIASDDMGVAGYGLNRLADSEERNDVESYALVWSQIFVIALPMAWICLKKLWIDRKSEIGSSHAFVLNIVLLLLLTVAAMSRQPLAQYRYFMMLLAFMPYAYPFLSNNIKTRNKILMGLSCVMIVWFYFQFELIIWNYAPELDIVIKPPFWMVFTNYWSL